MEEEYIEEITYLSNEDMLDELSRPYNDKEIFIIKEALRRILKNQIWLEKHISRM